MASIKPRTNKDGQITSYLITVSLGRDDQGRKICETKTYHPTETTPKKIEKEVQAFANAFEKRVLSGAYNSDAEKITFTDFIKIWKRGWGKKNLSESTLENYESILMNRIVPKIGKLPIGKITRHHLQTMIDDYEDESLSARSVRYYFTVTNSVLKYAYDEDYIDRNPGDKCHLPKDKKTGEDLHIFTYSQAERFLQFISEGYTTTHKAHKRTITATGETYQVPEYKEKHTFPTQFQVYFRLALDSGCRRGEMVSLTWKDIDLEKRTVSISHATALTKAGQIQKDPKTASGNRVIPIPQQSVDLLSKWKEEERRLCMDLGSAWKGTRGKDFDQNFIFITDEGSQMNIATPTHKFREIIDRYNGLCETEEDRLPLIRLHDLRHTHASWLSANGVDIQTLKKRMGHSKASTTLDIYGHPLSEMDEKASDTIAVLLP